MACRWKSWDSNAKNLGGCRIADSHRCCQFRALSEWCCFFMLYSFVQHLLIEYKYKVECKRYERNGIQYLCKKFDWMIDDFRFFLANLITVIVNTSCTEKQYSVNGLKVFGWIWFDSNKLVLLAVVENEYTWHLCLMWPIDSMLTVKSIECSYWGFFEWGREIK